MNNKFITKRVILFFLVLVILTLGWLTFSKKETPVIPINIDPVKTYTKLPEYIKGDLPIRSGKDLLTNKSFPKMLPVFSYGLRKISGEEALFIAQVLGFSTQPTTAMDVVDGKKLIWNNNTSSLWITPSKGYINYYLNDLKTETNSISVSEDELQKRAFDFLTKKIGFNEKDIVQTQTDYLVKSLNPEAGFESTVKKDAGVYQLNYTYKTLGYPVFTSIPSTQIIRVRVFPNGKILSAGVYFLENIKSSDIEYPVKNNNETLGSLSKSEIIEVENDYISLQDLTMNDIRDVKVNNIEIGYFFDELNQDIYLRPVFKLSTEVNIKNSQANKATLYLPAFK